MLKRVERFVMSEDSLSVKLTLFVILTSKRCQKRYFDVKMMSNNSSACYLGWAQHKLIKISFRLDTA
jgi:hypothetical protein